MLQPITIHLGKQTRELVWRGRTATVLEMQKIGDAREALLTRRNPGLVQLIAAALMSKGDDESARQIDALKVGKWLDEEPAKYRELEAKVMRAVSRGYAAMGLIDVTKQMVENGDATADMLQAQDRGDDPGNVDGVSAP